MGTVAAAQAAVHDAEFDCAVLDLNLHGESALPVAEWLMESGKPFAIATGYGCGAIPDRFKGVPRIEKPFDPPHYSNWSATCAVCEPTIRLFR